LYKVSSGPMVAPFKWRASLAEGRPFRSCGPALRKNQFQRSTADLCRKDRACLVAIDQASQAPNCMSPRNLCHRYFEHAPVARPPTYPGAL
jgi:hypothetical protein